MPKDPKEISRKRIFNNFFALEEVEIEDAETGQHMTRHIVVPKDAVAILMYKKDENKVIFSKQYRLAAKDAENPNLLEIPAGVLDKNESEEEAACRECLEETGYEVKKAEHIITFYSSPGHSAEKMWLFYAEVNAGDKKENGGGLAEENEQIKVIEMDFDAALKLIDEGKIIDSKTILALLWLYRKLNA